LLGAGFGATALLGAWLAPSIVVEVRAALRHPALCLSVVSVEGNVVVTAAEIAAATGLSPGTPLVDVDPTAVEARLLLHPWIRGARAQRLPPSRLRVTVEEREPTAVRLGEETGTDWLVDAEGTIFAPAAPEHLDALPQIRGAQEVLPGPADPRLARAAALARALAGRAVGPVAEIELPSDDDPEGLAFRLRGSARRILVGSSDIPRALDRLERLLAAGLAETAASHTIDLRFADRAILRRRDAGGA
jgi:cell division protein FtsQ